MAQVVVPAAVPRVAAARTQVLPMAVLPTAAPRRLGALRAPGQGVKRWVAPWAAPCRVAVESPQLPVPAAFPSLEARRAARAVLPAVRERAWPVRTRPVRAQTKTAGAPSVDVPRA